MRNIIDAICTIVSNPKYLLKEYADSHNRANSMGEALEEYVKDVFAETVGVLDSKIRNEKISETFSYLGNQNNPPDSIIRGGDAIEVKKIESNDSSLALNSSYPKAKLFSNSLMITRACKDCEEWTEKDMIYAVGVLSQNKLKSLAFVYGEDYCAEQGVYEKIKNVIKMGIDDIPNVEFTQTKELGKVNRVDPLGITYLRVRGMWGIENPFKVFRYLFNRDHSKDFNFMTIINKAKFQSFYNKELLDDLIEQHPTLSKKEVKIKDPNNPAILKEAILITYTI